MDSYWALKNEFAYSDIHHINGIVHLIDLQQVSHKDFNVYLNQWKQ